MCEKRTVLRRPRSDRKGFRTPTGLVLTVLLVVIVAAISPLSLAVGTGAPTVPGAKLPGSAEYNPPSAAVWVAPNGSDSGTGTSDHPFATIATAVDRAVAGDTIVLRAGSYHESVILPDTKQLMLEAYPGEAVWLEGSSVVDGWRPDGQRWVRDNWTVKFDSSPTYSRGAPDNTDPAWRFINPQYPMAAHPDQMWVDGLAMRQVGSLEQLSPGTFFADYQADRLYLGSNPSGKQVRASDLSSALVVAGPKSAVRGIGIRRYAPSVPDMGTVYVAPSAAGAALEEVLLEDNATTGLSLNASAVLLKHVTSENNGFLGIHATESDNLSVDGVLVRGNNSEHFNPAPAAGGFKVTSSRGLTIRNSSFQENDGVGLWFDESCFGLEVTGNYFTANRVHGLQVELSANALVANNRFIDNAGSGLEVQNSGQVNVWNNTFAGGIRGLRLIQDKRRASDIGSPGHDPRQPLPDPTVTWLTRNVVVKNNAFLKPAAASPCLLCMTSDEATLTAQEMQVSTNSNAWYPPVADGSRALATWLTGAKGNSAFPTLDLFRAATGQERLGAELPIAAGQDLQAQAVALAALSVRIAEPIPVDVARAVQLPVGTRMLGSALR